MNKDIEASEAELLSKEIDQLKAILQIAESLKRIEDQLRELRADIRHAASGKFVTLYDE